MHSKLPFTGEYRHFSYATDGATQNGDSMEEFNGRWMGNDGIFKNKHISFHNVEETDGTRLAEKTLTPLSKLGITSNQFNTYCTGADGDGALRDRKVAEKVEDMMGKTNEFKLNSEDICHLYSGTIKHVRKHSEISNVFSKQFTRIEEKFGDTRSMFHKDLKSVVPGYSRFKKFIDQHYSSHEHGSIVSYQHLSVGISYLCDTLKNENSEINGISTTTDSVCHHYIGHIQSLISEILAAPTLNDQMFCYLPWNTPVDYDYLMKAIDGIIDAFEKNMTNGLSLYPAELNRYFEKMDTMLEYSNGKIYLRGILNKTQLKAANHQKK